MEIIIAAISILAITSFIWALNRILKFKICPICAGGFLTWLWMLSGMLIGQLSVVSYQLLVGILMGGSVVGIAYQLEKQPAFSQISQNKLLIWKAVFMPAGFAAVYAALNFEWLVFAAIAAILGMFTALSVRRSRRQHREGDKTVKELEKKMEKCC